MIIDREQFNIVVRSNNLRRLLCLHSVLSQMPAFVVEESVRVSAPCYSLHQHTTNFPILASFNQIATSKSKSKCPGSLLLALDLHMSVETALNRGLGKSLGTCRSFRLLTESGQTLIAFHNSIINLLTFLPDYVL